MKRLLALLAIVGLVFTVGCGGDASTDGCGCGDDAAKTGGDMTKTMKDKADKVVKDADDAVKSAEITYTCGCGKEKTLSAEAAAPS